MDVEFITGHDTEEALLDWCARRRKEVVPGSAYLFGAELLIVLELFVIWRHEMRDGVAFVLSMVLLVGAFAVAAYSRDPDLKQPPRFPHAELLSLGMIACSLAITFEHKASILTFLLLTIVLVGLVGVGFRGWHAFSIARERIPFHGRAVHVHLDRFGMQVTLRPNPQARRIAWKKVRYLGADARSLFVVGGLVPVVVPRRAFPTPAAWDEFVSTTARYAKDALNSDTAPPIGKHVRSSTTRRTPVATSSLAARDRARWTGSGSTRSSRR
jgi:hypothetical protein